MTQACQPSAPESPVWTALKDFAVDEPDNDLTFIKRLARENRWSQNYAQRVFDEYKRFIFLAVASGHRVTPSDQVDQAWHLHLAYTESYWKDLCDGVLGQPLHHGPTKGGRAEDDKFYDWYGRTLESYQRIFGHQPPVDIWPAPAERFNRNLRFNRLNTNGYWLIKKPELKSRKSILAGLFVFLSSAVFAACSSETDSSALFGSILLGGLVLVIVFAVVGSRNRRNRGGSAADGGDGCGSHVDSSDSGCDSDGGGSDGGGSSGCGSSGCGGGGCGSS